MPAIQPSDVVFCPRHPPSHSLAGGEWWDFLTRDGPRDQRNLRLLMETVQELYLALDPLERMRRALDRVLDLTGAERGILFLFEDGEARPYVARGHDRRDLPLDLSYSRSTVREVCQGRVPFRRTGPGEDVALTNTAVALELVSLLVAPLEAEGSLLGALYVDARYGTRQAFTEPEEKTFRAIAGLVGGMLRSAQLEQARVERDRLVRQVGYARAIQERLLPIQLPTVEGYDLAGEGRACYALSGDYYDVIPRDTDRVLLVVGDVCGHGLGQAIYMAMVRAQVHLMAREGFELPRMLGRLNEFLVSTLSTQSFMSLFVGELDRATGTLTWSSAGHNPPVLVRADGRVEELLPTGRVLGPQLDSTYALAGPKGIGPGDVLWLYTDGLTEARSPDQGIYTTDRLHPLLARLAQEGLGAADFLRGVLEDVDRYRGPRPLCDDLTALAVRRTVS